MLACRQGERGTQERQSPKRAGTSARPALPREFIALHKQRRIMDALAELTAEQGYEATKIADIVRRAGVARKTLYDNFEGKEEVFLGGLRRRPSTRSCGRVEEACAAADGDWEDRVEAGLARLPRLCRREADPGADVHDRGAFRDPGRRPSATRTRSSASSS